TLALGIAFQTAILAVANAYLLKTLPFTGANRLHNIIYSRPGEQAPRGMEKLDWKSLGDILEHAVWWDLDVFYIIGGDHPEAARGAWVTPDFMQVFGVQAELGRVFRQDEFLAGSPQVALISHALWQSRYGGDPRVVGRQFQAYVSDRPDEAETFTIIGVMPSGFWHVNPYTEIFAPLRAPGYPYMARLRESVSADVAASRITDLVRQGAGSVPDQWRAVVRSTHNEYVNRVRPVLYAIGAAATIVLLIACANVAFLMLIRANRRQKEVAMRLALGASRGQVARMLVSESVLLAAAAAALGTLLATFLLRSLAPLIQQQLGRPAPGGDTALSIDGTVLVGVALLAFLISLALTLGPLVISWRRSLLETMRRGKQGGVEGIGGRRSRQVLIALEVAGSLALLVGCGLMLRTVLYMLDVDLGIQPQQLISTAVALRDRTYPDEVARLAFHERLLTRLRAVPGVESAALANWPLLAIQPPQPIQTEGGPEAIAASSSVVGVTPDFFATAGIPVVHGRTFEMSDRAGSEPVALVSETLARRLWPNSSALGSRVRVRQREHRVVGVVRDLRQGPTDEDLADLFVPFMQAPSRFASVVLKVNAPSPSWTPVLRQAVKEIDPEVTLNPIQEVQLLVHEQMSRPRFLAGLLTGFSFFALLLALIGIYGVIAYGVKQREHEIAVRMAVGADAGSVIRLFMSEGAGVLLAGLGIGLAGAYAIGRILEAQLYGVRPLDPVTLVATAAGIAIAGGMAVWWSARRAAATDPAIALRDE
ncbi:MAG: ABC transporter permease, partial [Acidobacteria bacterium]|nr:ABC transporter permease [Acidobacteriota bacterium]